MTLFDRIKTFLRADSGAVTVDWVMMTAFAVGLVVALFLSLGTSTVDYSLVIADAFTTRAIPTY